MEASCPLFAEPTKRFDIDFDDMACPAGKGGYTRSKLNMTDRELQDVQRKLIRHDLRYHSKYNNFFLRSCEIFCGTLALFFILLPGVCFALFIALVTSPFPYLFRDKNNVRRSREYTPARTISYPCCWPFASHFFASWRLHLILNKDSYFACYGVLGPLWFIQDAICGTYQNIQLLMGLAKSKYGSIQAMETVNELANFYGDYFPFNYGIGTISSDRIYNECLELRTKQKRDAFLANIPAPPFAHYYASRFEPTWSSTYSPAHRIGKGTLAAALAPFGRKLSNPTARASLSYRVQKLLGANKFQITEINSDSMSVLVSQISKVLYVCMFDYDLSEEDATAVANFINFGAAAVLTGSPTQFFMFGNLLESFLDASFRGARDVIRKMFLQPREKLSDGAIEVLNFTDKYKKDGADIRYQFGAMVIQMHMAGVTGVSQIINTSLNFMLEDPLYYSEVYEKNKYRFLVEASRFGGALTFANVMDEEEELIIGGRRRKIPKGTRLSMLHINRNHDKSIFGENTEEFDPDRKGLMEVTSWNAPERLFEGNGTKVNEKQNGGYRSELKRQSVRYCPGHDLALFIAEMVVDYYAQQIVTREGIKNKKRA